MAMGLVFGRCAEQESCKVVAGRPKYAKVGLPKPAPLTKALAHEAGFTRLNGQSVMNGLTGKIAVIEL